MKRDRDIKSVLFVCTGNSCRSAMAEGLLKKMLRDAGRTGVAVKSAGIAAMGGFSASDKAVKVMKKTGVDISGHRSSGLSRAMIEKADLILTMDYIHKDEVLKAVPSAASKTHLLKEYTKTGGAASSYIIEDPIGMPLEVYERVLVTLKESLKELMKKI